MLIPADAFFAGHTGRITVGSTEFDLTVEDLGTLRVPSGRLGASDPFVNLDRPLEVTIPAGEYRVSVTIADVSEKLDGSHLREAYLSCWISDGEVARVEAALPPGHEPLPDGEFYGVPVDAGTVAFAGVVGVETGMPPGNWYDDLFEPPTGAGWFSQMDDPSHYRAGVANISIPYASKGENVVLSHSGWGDGFYPVVTTFDEAERLLAVHIDLMVVAPGE